MSTPHTRRSFLARSAGAGLALVAAPYVLTRPHAVTANPEPQPDAEGYIPLFDGNTLTGWHKNPQRIGHGTGGLWTVEEGAICGEQDPPGSGNGGILLTDRTFGDFELLLEMKPDWGIDSGLFLRSTDQGQCVQMMVDYHEDGNVGHLYGEGTGGWSARPFDLKGVYDDREAVDETALSGLTTRPSERWDPGHLVSTCTGEEFARAWKVHDWNACKVRCTGQFPKITTWVNDLLVCEFDAGTFRHPQYDREQVARTLGREGHVAVQVHGGRGAWPAGAKCRWRNIRVKPL